MPTKVSNQRSHDLTSVDIYRCDACDYVSASRNMVMLHEKKMKHGDQITVNVAVLDELVDNLQDAINAMRVLIGEVNNINSGFNKLGNGTPYVALKDRLVLELRSLTSDFDEKRTQLALSKRGG